MSGTSFIRAVGLGGVVLLALAAGGPANAGSEKREAPSVYEDTYTGPPVIRRIPGIRILFGDSALEEEEYDDLYGQKKKKKKQQQEQLDESYYEPAPSAKPKVVKPPAKTAAKPPANPALPQKSASSAPAKPLADGPLSCEKATSVVSGYGFSSVEAATCSGKLYAFNAKRGGNSFAIKLDPASGELTEVKKLP